MKSKIGDGYKFGNSEIYNPYSILKYIDKKEVGAYCPISTNNFLIKSFFENLEKDVFHELELLFSDKETIKTIYSDPDFSDIKKPQNIWQLLVHSGYLTVKKRIDRNLYSLTIPNKEIEEFGIIPSANFNVDIYYDLLSLKPILKVGK